MYGLLEKLVAGPGFLAKLTAALGRKSAGVSCTTGSEVMQPEWWEAPQTDSKAEPSYAEAQGYEQVSNDEAQAVEPLESYVMVEKEDVLEAIGTFVAAYLAELPQAQNLQPAELQVAIRNAFKVRLIS